MNLFFNKIHRVLSFMVNSTFYHFLLFSLLRDLEKGVLAAVSELSLVFETFTGSFLQITKRSSVGFGNFLASGRNEPVINDTYFKG